MQDIRYADIGDNATAPLASGDAAGRRRPSGRSRHAAVSRQVLRKVGRVGELVGVRRDTALPGGGAPPGVPWADLEELAQRLRVSPLTAARHRHMSGWKATGAYKVRLLGRQSKSVDVFCKLNEHSPRAIAALDGFPAMVGRAETSVLLTATPELRRHVPELYLSRDLGDAVTILFMEALGSRWHSCTSLARDLVLVAATTARMHRDLAEWHVAKSPTGLIEYDKEFSEQLNVYAEQRLASFADKSGDPWATAIVQNWNALSALYLEVPGGEPATGIVHGDLNTANVFIHVARRRAKVIDWEWAGVGDVYRDLAALLKRTSPKIERRALRAYHDAAGGCLDWRRYQRCQVERGLLDAAFLSVQLDHAEHGPRMDLPMYIRSSLRRVLDAAATLRS